MATAVFLDAIVIRTILLLAVLELLVPSPVGRETATAGSRSNRTWPPSQHPHWKSPPKTSFREHSGPSISQ
jgi:hypothetical protein